MSLYRLALLLPRNYDIIMLAACIFTIYIYTYTEAHWFKHFTTIRSTYI